MIRVKPGPGWPQPGASIHVVGVAGVGMNAVAQVLQARGYAVSGSDRIQQNNEAESPILETLARQGIAVQPQDGRAVTRETGALVISSAIEPDNPDLIAAQGVGVPVFHRAEALAAAIGGDRCIAVAGTSGKTTVAGMLGWLLTELGMSPNVVNGGGILNWKSADDPGNVRVTGSEWWVIEVDESDRSLLQFHPEWALINTISRDHFGLEETVDLFAQFAGQVKRGVLCGPGVEERLAGRVAGTAELSSVKETSAFPVPLRLPGRHNLANARMAVALCEALGYAAAQVLELLPRFEGIERRLERVGQGGGITVYDDYAHNPAKIEAAWSAVAEEADRVLGVWRPHGYGPLEAMQKDLVALFERTCCSGDILYLLPVYYAGGTANKRVHSEALAHRLMEKNLSVHYCRDYEELETELIRVARSGDAVLCMGARDPHLPVFARLLAKRLKSIAAG